jgi:hypothetical protein
MAIHAAGPAVFRDIAWADFRNKMLAPLVGLATAVIAVLTVFRTVVWTPAQTTLVTTEAGAALGFLWAVLAHIWPGTQKQPVALAATFTALCAATVALGSGFAWWHWTGEQMAAVNGLVTAFVGVGTALLAHNRVSADTTPRTPQRRRTSRRLAHRRLSR